MKERSLNFEIKKDEESKNCIVRRITNITCVVSCVVSRPLSGVPFRSDIVLCFLILKIRKQERTISVTLIITKEISVNQYIII